MRTHDKSVDPCSVVHAQIPDVTADVIPSFYGNGLLGLSDSALFVVGLGVLLAIISCAIDCWIRVCAAPDRVAL